MSGRSQLLQPAIGAAGVSVHARHGSSTELREFLEERLPDYMVPSTFVWLNALPLTPNGKVDRGALPVPVRQPERPYAAPRSVLERALLRIWQDVLGIDGIGVSESFFELGGDSIQAAIIANRIQETLGEHTHVAALFDAPTVAELAEYLRTHYAVAAARFEGVAAGARSDGRPTAVRIEDHHIANVRELLTPFSPMPRSAPSTFQNPSAVFVLAPPRSGSTLLRIMLGGHPSLFSPPELELLPFETLQDRRSSCSGRRSFMLEGTIRALMEIRGCDVDEAKREMEVYERQGLHVQRFYGLLQEWIGNSR